MIISMLIFGAVGFGLGVVVWSRSELRVEGRFLPFEGSGYYLFLASGLYGVFAASIAAVIWIILAGSGLPSQSAVSSADGYYVNERGKCVDVGHDETGGRDGHIRIILGGPREGRRAQRQVDCDVGLREARLERSPVSEAAP